MPLQLNMTNVQVTDALSRALNVTDNVLDHGVDNTGATDCTAAFNAAIAANEGKTLHVPKGIYLLSEGAVAGTCLAIHHSIALVLDPGAVLKLATTADVPLVTIGDNSTAFSHVTMVGGRLDGDASNSTIAPLVRTSLLEVRGPVTDVLVSDMPIGNAKLGGVEVSGTDSANRAKRVFFDRCPVDNVTEGVVFQNCDGFHWTGGDITNMTAQDCFEPHGNIDGWSLRDCTIAGADPTNSEIEVYPQVGDIKGGVVEDVIVKGEMRVAISSPDTNWVDGLHIGAGTVFEHGLLYAGVGTGKFRGLVVDNAEFIGPATNVPRNVPTTHKSGIHAFGADNRIDVRNCRVHGYDGTGIHIECDEAQITGNRIYNNANEGSLAGYLRSGLRALGAHTLVQGNRVYDDRPAPTQTYTPQINGDYAQIIGNHFSNADTFNRNLGTGWVSAGNIGDIQDMIDVLVTMPAGRNWVNVDQSKFPMLEHSGPMKWSQRVQVTAISDMAPAATFRPFIGAGNWRIVTDVPVTSDTTFHVQAILTSDQSDATL